MRKKITIIERVRFLMIANSAISKLNSEKNRLKPHWGDQTKEELLSHLFSENVELQEAISTGYPWEIEDECKDNIALALMIFDNAWSEKNE